MPSFSVTISFYSRGGAHHHERRRALKKLFRLQCFLDAEKIISTHQPKKVTEEYLIEYEFERIEFEKIFYAQLL